MTKKKNAPPKTADATRPDALLAGRDAAFAPSPATWAMMLQTVGMARAANLLRPGMTEDEAMLVLVKGWEVGLPQLQALDQIYFADDRDKRRLVLDTAGQKALILQKRLGMIEPVEMDSQHAVVKATRLDHLGRREALFTYDLARAQADGLLGRASWASGANREGLLLARATSAACRGMFEDAMGGLGYTAEEVQAFSGGAGNSASSGVGGGTQRTESRRGGDTALPPSTSTPTPPNGHDPSQSPASSAGPEAPPTPPAAVATAPPVPPADRPLNTQAGYTNDTQPRLVYTHGISMPTMTTILKATKEKAGSPTWRESEALVSERLAALGIDPRLPGRVCYLTEAEGVALRDAILGLPPAGQPSMTPAEARETAATLTAAADASEGKMALPEDDPEPEGRGIAWRAAYNGFVAAIRQALGDKVAPAVFREKRAELEQLVCLVSRVEKIGDVTDETLVEATREVPTFIAQPATLRMLFERARANVGA